MEIWKALRNPSKLHDPVDLVEGVQEILLLLESRDPSDTDMPQYIIPKY